MPESPVEPPGSDWSFPEPDRWPADDDLVAIGADLEPGTLLAAYRSGLFPMPLDPAAPASDPPYWFSPRRRGVLPLDGLRVTRSLRRMLPRYEIRVDTAFTEVVAACADPRRPASWITPAVAAAYGRLFEAGWAHSVEAWREGRLVGGLYGVASGGLFAGESMFHLERDASKAALVALVGVLRDRHASRRLLDVQWSTAHLASLGVVEIDRSDYLRRLADALVLPAPDWPRPTAPD